MAPRTRLRRVRTTDPRARLYWPTGRRRTGRRGGTVREGPATTVELDTFRALLTPGGQALLAEAAALGPTEATLLPCITRLRRRHPALAPALVAAALEQVILR